MKKKKDKQDIKYTIFLKDGSCCFHYFEYSKSGVIRKFLSDHPQFTKKNIVVQVAKEDLEEPSNE